MDARGRRRGKEEREKRGEKERRGGEEKECNGMSKTLIDIGMREKIETFSLRADSRTLAKVRQDFGTVLFENFQRKREKKKKEKERKRKRKVRRMSDE